MKKIYSILILFCLLSQFLFAQNKINQYEYWFDSNYANKITTSITPVVNFQLNTQISTASLAPGLHTIHFRFRDDSLKYSSVISQFFYKTANTGSSPSSTLSSYEYWFDNNYAGKVYVNFSGTNSTENLISNINTSSLTQGLHTFHIRFKDNNDKWSVVLSQFFYKQNNQGGGPTSNLTAYEYWFDNDYNNATIVTFSGNNQQENLITNINTSVLNSGLHTFHIRFKDSTDKWSVVLSQFFYKIPSQNNVTNNLITAYRYWIDNNHSNLNSIYFNVPTPNVNLIDDLDLTNVWKGQHTIHFQFKDTLGMWSVVTTDTIIKAPYPIARFLTSDSTVCVGDTVYFTSTSVDGDAHAWDFGDGNFSSDSLTAHAYSSAGTYIVSLTVNDTLTGKDSTITQTIYVTAYPNTAINIIGNDTLCQGESSQLVSQASNVSYLWNTLEQTSSITVSNQGEYFAIITSLDNSSCFVTSDTVSIIVNPLPIVNLGNDTSICEGNSLVLNASNPNSSYLWNTGAQTPNITVSTSNQYYVTVTNQYNCIQSDTISVIVNPLPIAGFTYTINNQTVTFSNTSQHGVTYSWDFGDGENSISPSPTHTYPASGGTFTVQLTVTNNCGTNTYTQVITIAPNNIEEHTEKQFEVSIFPNPARDRVNINIELDSESTIQVNIYDYTGKLIQNLINESRPQGTQYLWYNTQQLSAGVYYVEINNNENRMVKKLVINK